MVKMKPLTSSDELNSVITPRSEENILDGCQYVYIDLGTNIGVQIRKLYEPHLYINASILPLFQTLFENNTGEVCAVGFEANPIHSDYLKEFENYCLKRNWRVKIFVPMAVSTRDGNVTFYTTPGDQGTDTYQVAASLDMRADGKANITVPSIDIVSWFKNTVLTRKIPGQWNTSRVVMKHDIEEHDPYVLANFILRGVYCSLDVIYGEHLTNDFRKSVVEIQKYSKSCQTKLIDMDDESYVSHRFPFVIPQASNST